MKDLYDEGIKTRRFKSRPWSATAIREMMYSGEWLEDKDAEESDEVECCDCGAVGNYEDFYLDRNEHWLCPECRDFYKGKENHTCKRQIL